MFLFWLASEDHDFDEINHIHLFGQTIQWDSSQGGAVGRMNLSDFKRLDELNAVLGDSKCRVSKNYFSQSLFFRQSFSSNTCFDQ